MKIIINSDLINKIFKTKQPTVLQILNNKFISHMIKNCKIISVYKDDMNANDLGNYVIKVIPSLKGIHRGK